MAEHQPDIMIICCADPRVTDARPGHVETFRFMVRQSRWEPVGRRTERQNLIDDEPWGLVESSQVYDGMRAVPDGNMRSRYTIKCLRCRMEKRLKDEKLQYLLHCLATATLPPIPLREFARMYDMPAHEIARLTHVH